MQDASRQMLRRSTSTPPTRDAPRQRLPQTNLVRIEVAGPSVVNRGCEAVNAQTEQSGK